MRHTIIAVIGASGSGKTTAVEFASKALDIPVVRSYTTRKMREGEHQGVEHIFVPEGCRIPSIDDMVAYTFFGGCHYWALKSQVESNDACLYVIDEDGFRDLNRRFGDKYNLVSVHVVGMVFADEKRKERDKARVPLDHYDAEVRNDSNKESFLYAFTRTIDKIVHYHDVAM